MTTIIRLACAADAPAIRAIYAPLVARTPITFETQAPSVAEMRRRIAGLAGRMPWLVCARDGRRLGYAYASAHRERAGYRWSVDVSVYVAARARRHGVGRALYTSLLQILALQGFVNAYAGITLPNRASVRLHEAMGFRPIGIYRRVGHKLGAWHDVGWWSRTLRAAPARPAEPRSLRRVTRAPAWQAALDAGLRAFPS